MFGITSSEEVFNEYGVEDGKIVAFKKVRVARCAPRVASSKRRRILSLCFLQYDDEEDKVVYSGEFTGKEDYEIKNLQKFIAVHSLPLVVEFNQDTAQKIFSGEIKSHLLVFLSKEAGHFEKYVDVIREPAKKYRGEVWKLRVIASRRN